MLGADPRDYSEDDDIGYTIPDERTRPVGISKTLLIAGASMIAFPIVQGILSKSLKGLSRYTAGVAKRYAGERYNQVYNRIGGSPTLGKILGESQPVKDMTTKYLRWRGDISEYTGIKNAQGIVTKVGWANQAKGRWQHVRSFFKDYGTTAFRSRMMGASENFVKGYLKVLPSVYLSDKAISLFTGEKRKEGTAWWNIPGHVVNTAADVLTTSAAYLPIHAAFAGIMGGAKLAKESVVRSARYASLRHHTSRGSTSILAETLGNVFSKVDDFRTKLLGTEQHPGFEARIRGATKEWFRSFSTDWKDKKPATMDTIDYWKGNIVAGWKKGIVPPRHFLAQVPHAQFLKDIEKVSGFPMGSNTVQILKMISNQYKRPKMGFLSRMAGLRPLRVKEYIGNQNIEQFLSKESIKNVAANMPEDQRVNLRKWLSTAYMGKGIYQGPFGRPINISRWQPTAVLDRSIDFLHERLGFNTPFGELRPFEMFRVKRMKDWLLGKGTSVYDWTEGNTVRVGPHPDINTTMNNYNPYGATVTLEPGAKQRMLFVNAKGGGGKMFYHQEGMADAVDITPEGMSYRLVHEPLHGSLRRVQDRYYGKLRDPLNRFEARNPDEEMRMMQESYGWPKWRAFLHAKVLRTPVDRYNMEEKHGRWPGLEIGAGYGSSPGPLRRLGNFYMKYFREDSPLVVFNKDKGFLSQIRKERNPGNYISEGNVDDAGRFISQTRNMLSDALDSSWHNIRSRKVYERFSKHTVQVPGWEGKAPTFEDLYGDSLSSRQRLVTAVDRILGVPGSESPANRRIRHILDMVKDDEGQWSHVAAKSPTGKELTAGDELQKYIFRYHLVGQARTTRGQRYLQNLTKDINIGRERLFTGINPDRTMMRSIDNLSRLESMAGDIDFGELKGPRRELLLHELLGPTRAAKHGRINNIVDFMMGESQNLDELSQVFNPPTSTRLPNILHAPIYSGTTTTSPYEAVISGSPSLGGIFRGDKKDIRSIMGAIRNTILPRYANKYGDIDQNAQPILQPHRFLMEATMRFERLGEGLGLGLNPSTRTTWQDIWAGTFSRVVLPGMALYSGYKALDTFTDTSPLFSGTALDEGLSVGLAEQYVKSNLLAASVYDTIGVTPASKYMEGLMPGFVSSPAARLARAVGPPILGAAFGMKFGPHGAGLGVITGTAISALSGFGTYDMTKTRKELEDIYSGRELVPIRKSRGWEMNREPYFGCLIGESLIDTDTGYRPISEISIGDRVLSINGRYNNVLATSSRDYTGGVYNFRTHFDATDNVFVTDHHPILVVRTRNCTQKPCVCRITSYDKCAKCKHHYYEDYKPEWIEAKDVEVGDYLVFPNRNLDINNDINLLEFISGRFTINDDGIFYNMNIDYKYSHEDLVRMKSILEIGSRKRRRELLREYAYQQNYDYMKLCGVIHDIKRDRIKIRERGLREINIGFNPTIDLDYDFGLLMGYYASEGCSLNNTVQFTFHVNEIDYHNDVLRLMKKYFNIDGIIDRSGNPNGVQIRFCSNIISDIFSNLIPGSARKHDKKLSKILEYTSREFKIGFLTAFCYGDGYYQEDRNRIRIGVSTYELLKQIQLLFLDCGYYTSLAVGMNNCVAGGDRKYTTYSLYVSNILNENLIYNTSIKELKNSMIEFDDYNLIRINSIDTKEHNGLVYDIQVEDCECFCGKTATYHNSRIGYWRPSWFSKMKSQYQYTPDMYGSKLEEFIFRNPIMQPFALAVDPYHWERKSYFSSPYPETGAVLESIPFIGPALSTTVGRALKPIKLMHKAELQASFNGPGYMSGISGIGPGYFPPPGIQADIPSPFVPATMAETNSEGLEIRRPYPISQHSVRQTVGRLFNTAWTEPFGLWGWGSSQAMGGGPAINDVVMANSGERTSVRRALWDMQLGGGAIVGEYLRRFYPRMQTTLERWNPLKNKSPSWLPGGPESKYFTDFRTGSPYDKIKDSELRLPGWGNMSAYHVSLSMPFRASQLGKSYEEMIQYITGTAPPTQVYEEEVMEAGTTMHRMVQDELRRSNLLVKAEAPVYEPYSDISGTVDAIVREGRRKVALEIKTVDSKKLASLAAPQRQHMSQLNFYLKVLGLPMGKLVYISRDDPSKVKSFPVHYSEGAYRRDLSRLQQARSEGYQLLRKGYGEPGEAYSHLDRLRVLADVAAYSDEYKRELSIVNRRDRLGLLSPEEHEEKLKILRRRDATARQYDLYPRRFDLKHIIKPDSTYKIMAENEYTKAASEYNPIARVAGGAWEYITHQRSPLHTKMMATYSPREQYERYSLYGTKNSFWTEPWRDFVEPYMRATLSTHRPDEGIMRGLQAGYLFGGPAGAVVGAGALGVYGAVNAGFQWLTDSTYIPGNVKKKWEIADYFDKLKYIKARRLYMITGSKEYAQTMGETMTGIDPTGNQWKLQRDIARAIPPDIKPYIFAFIQTTDPGERDKIAKEVPDPVAQLLRVRWAANDKSDSIAKRAGDSIVSNRMKSPGDSDKEVQMMAANYRQSQDLTGYFNRYNMPPEDWAGFDPRIRLEDVELKTVKKMGYSAFDFGQGYADQMRRVRYSPYTPGPINMNDPTGNEVYPELGVDRNELRSSIMSVLTQYGAKNVNVNVSITPGVGSLVQINASKEAYTRDYLQM